MLAETRNAGSGVTSDRGLDTWLRRLTVLNPDIAASWGRSTCDANSTLMTHASQFDDIAQVRQIGKLVELMDEAGIDFWLSGGWAVDFHIGRVTRHHSDIDFIVKLNDKSRLGDLLEGAGAALTRSDEAGSVESFELDNGQIEITYVAKDGKGSYFTPGYESWPYPEGSFPEKPLTLAGITVRAVSALGLLDMKERWEENFDEKPRPHDLADIEALRNLLGSN